jgi:hypothetical protein
MNHLSTGGFIGLYILHLPPKLDKSLGLQVKEDKISTEASVTSCVL